MTKSTFIDSLRKLTIILRENIMSKLLKTLIDEYMMCH